MPMISVKMIVIVTVKVIATYIRIEVIRTSIIFIPFLIGSC